MLFVLIVHSFWYEAYKMVCLLLYKFSAITDVDSLLE